MEESYKKKKQFSAFEVPSFSHLETQIFLKIKSS